MKFIALLTLACLLATPSAYPAQNSAGIVSGHSPRKDQTSQFRPENVVVEIRKSHIDLPKSLQHVGLTVVSSNGTGWCLGQGKCDYILTNYHVAEQAGSPLKVNGVAVLQTYEATSPQDAGAAREKLLVGFSMKFVRVRDIAIFRMERSLNKMHGIPFSIHELRDGENVKIYGHPGGKELTMALATFDGEAKDGLLFFKVKSGEEGVLIPGLSGSLVMNEKNEAVGLVQGVAQGNMVAVVPVWSIADFVKKVQPDKYQEIFPSSREAMYRPGDSEIAPVDFVAESEALAKDADSEDGVSPPPALPEEYLWYNLDKPTPSLAPGVTSNGAHVRVEEPPNVQILRGNAEAMVENIKDFIAVGTQRSIGGKTPEITIQYKLRMVAGSQTFTMDGKETRELPCPEEGITPSTAWANFPALVGNNLKLSIQQVDDLSLQGWGNVKVFRYGGTAEDKVASIDYCENYGLGIHTETVISVPVRGEVWTDESMNILRITQELLAPASKGFQNLQTSVLYGWLSTPNGERRLVPTNIFARADRTDDHQTYSTFCRITDYHQFTVSVVVGDQRSGPSEPDLSSRRNRDAGHLRSEADQAN